MSRRVMSYSGYPLTVLTPGDLNNLPLDTSREPDYWYVIPVAGQSNGMAYGEGLPLPDTLDAPHPRIKQLARRATVTPGGAACQYNDIVPLDHCPHDVQDMSKMNHPRADLAKGQYGTVSQALHIAKSCWHTSRITPVFSLSRAAVVVRHSPGVMMACITPPVAQRRPQHAGAWVNRYIRI
ncbi:hypothetical protein [Salmonella enterica]|uniref:hypothetical protein n=1 Tax=Salmonella enterica TaxID=28901 RepID=UPI001EFCA139|nr:hypothetical protein [Salmonella enterica]